MGSRVVYFPQGHSEQFRALSDQMYKSPEHHKHIRKEIVKQLKDHRSLYEGYVPMKYKRYYRKMAKSGEWGDHLTLQAAADKFSSAYRKQHSSSSTTTAAAATRRA